MAGSVWFERSRKPFHPQPAEPATCATRAAGVALAACLMVPSAIWAGPPQSRAGGSTQQRTLTQAPILIQPQNMRHLYLVKSGGAFYEGENPNLPGFQPYGVCPDDTVTHTDSSFTGGSYILQMGFEEQEYAACTYKLDDPDLFPIRLDLAEMIFAHQANVTTTTQWTFSVWEGNPETGTLVANFSSGQGDLPAIQIPPGTNGVNVAVAVDPGDPEQIIIEDNGNQTFAIGYRIDVHNSPTDPFTCIIPPDPQANAFPVVDVSGLAVPTRNWIFAINCPGPCPTGWSRFSELGACTPSGDWVMRVTYTPVNCSQPPIIDSVSPISALNGPPQPTELTIDGQNFLAGATAVRLTRLDGPLPIVGSSVMVNPEGTQITADFDLLNKPIGLWTVEVTVDSEQAELVNGFEIEAPPPPIVSSITPDSGPNTITVTATVFGENFAPGATSVELSLGTAAIIEGTDVSASTGELTASFDLTGMPTGYYDVTVDTGQATATLVQGFQVTPPGAPPTILFVDPPMADNCPTPVSLTIFGNGFLTGAQVDLVKAGNSDVGCTNVVVFDNTLITADVDPAGLALGEWSVRVTNTDTQSGQSEAGSGVTFATCTPDATSIAPNQRNNHQQSVHITNLAGSNFVAGADVRMTKSGQPDVVATNVVVLPGNSQITCDFAIYLIATGQWNIVVTNPGGGSDSLPNAFTINPGPAPNITTVIPANPDNCDPWTATILGSNFLVGAQSRLILGGQPDIVATSVTWISSSQLSAIFDLTGVATTPTSDKWDCRVTNPDNQFFTRVNAVNVTACPITCIPGDMNDDGAVDGADIDAFVRVLIDQTGTPQELCAANLAAPAGVDMADLAALVECLVNENCP